MENKANILIREAIEAQGLTLEAASLKSGLDRSYFRKLFERGGSSPKGNTLKKIASGLGLNMIDLIVDDEPIAVSASSTVRPASVSISARSSMPNDVPVMGTAAGSHLKGAFQLSSDPIDRVRRPPALIDAKDIYALYVEGSSMEPQFWPGELIFVNPHKPARVGDAVVIQCQNGSDHEIDATLGIYLRKTAEKFIIHKHNPSSDMEMSREIVRHVHKVLTTNEMYGV